MKIGEAKIDVKKQEEGDWVGDIPEFDGVRFKVRGLQNHAYRKLERRLIDGLPRQKRVGGRLDPETQDDITNKLVHQTVLEDWEGFVDEEGNPYTYTKERAWEIITSPEYRRVRDAIVFAATVVVEQKTADAEAITKN